MELRDIAVFVQVVEDGDFSTAARTLSLTPSAVSKSITRLEDQLGRRLLHRSSRAMRLTPEGQGFLDAAQRCSTRWRRRRRSAPPCPPACFASAPCRPSRAINLRR